MNYKKLYCIALCVAIMLCSTGCRTKTTDDSLYSVVTEYYYEYDTDNKIDSHNTSTTHNKNNSSNKTSSEKTNSKNNSSQKTHSSNNQSTTSTTNTTNNKNNTSSKFDKIEHVDYKVIQNKIGCDTIYTISDVITDKGDNILSLVDIACDTPGVLIDGLQICVPFNVRKTIENITLKISTSNSDIPFSLMIPFDSWKLVFEDDFNGTKLDTTKWSYSREQFRDKGYPNYWNNSMSFLDGKGNLVSRAQVSSNTFSNIAYLSGAINTKDKFTHTYGYYEARVKLHTVSGMWGAFWMLCGDMTDSNAANDNSNVNGVEIDIFESIFKGRNNEQFLNCGIHWDGFTNTKSNGKHISYPAVFDGEFHKFGLLWTEKEYIYYFDDVEVRRITPNEGTCNQPGYILLTTECGTWGGSWVLKDGEYSDMLVDYVRVYDLS